MSGRESSVFSFQVDIWIADLLRVFQAHIRNQESQVGRQLESAALQEHTQQLNSLPSDDAKAIKADLRRDAHELASLISQCLLDGLKQQEEILSKYLSHSVFFVPATAIMTISPLQVPLPSQHAESETASTSTQLSRHAQQKKQQAALDKAAQQEEFRTVLRRTAELEATVSQLKQRYKENKEYMAMLQNILHSLLQLDEIVKANDTETAVARVISTLRTGYQTLYNIQVNLEKRGIRSKINIKNAPTEPSQ